MLKTLRHAALAPLVAGLLAALPITGCRGGNAPGEDPGARAAAEQARARAEAAARLETARLAELWTYADAPAGKGRQLSAAISSRDDVDVDGHGAKRVQLVFRDHPAWGRSSYLVLQSGDFDCYAGCSVRVSVDDGDPKPMAGRRPRTDEAIAMFINDAHTLGALTRGASRLSIEFPVKAGGTRTAVFEIAGLDRSKLPGWDAKARGAAGRQQTSR
jgi:hypothetical protein